MTIHRRHPGVTAAIACAAIADGGSGTIAVANHYGVRPGSARRLIVLARRAGFAIPDQRGRRYNGNEAAIAAAIDPDGPPLR